MLTKEEAIAWHTGEAYNWIANTEYLYLKAQKCRSAQALKRVYGRFGPKRKFNTRCVNWEEVLRDVKE